MSYAASDAEAYESEGFEFGSFRRIRRGKSPSPAAHRVRPRAGAVAAKPAIEELRHLFRPAPGHGQVGAQIKTNSEAISNVGAKLNATAAQLKKEFDERKKDSDNIRNDTNQKVSMLALLPLIMTPPTYTIPPNTQIGVDATTNAVINTTATGLSLAPPSTSISNALLPLLLVGGLGGTSGSGSTGGMDNTMLLVMALVLANPH